MIWEYSDGTTVELGGSVTGDSFFAQYLREEIDTSPMVVVRPHPGGADPLKPDDPAQLNAWLAQRLEWLTRVRGSTVTLTAAPPDIPPLPEFRYEHVPGRVY